MKATHTTVPYKGSCKEKQENVKYNNKVLHHYPAKTGRLDAKGVD
jgi:hypothetical protein